MQTGVIDDMISKDKSHMRILLQGAYVGLRCYLESYLEKRNY